MGTARASRGAHVSALARPILEGRAEAASGRIAPCRSGSCPAHFGFGGRTRSQTPEAARASDTIKSTIEAASIELLQQTPPSIYLVTSCRFFNCKSVLRLGGMLWADMVSAGMACAFRRYIHYSKQIS